jgi:hypothetical protein
VYLKYSISRRNSQHDHLASIGSEVQAILEEVRVPCSINNNAGTNSLRQILDLISNVEGFVACIKYMSSTKLFCQIEAGLDTINPDDRMASLDFSSLLSISFLRQRDLALP